MKSTLAEISGLIQELESIHEFCANHADVDEKMYDRQSQIMERLTLLDGYKKFALQTDILRYF